MQRWLRRGRAAIAMGFTWAIAWGVVGLVPRWVFGFNADAPFPIVFGIFGFISGVMFSGLLALTEGRRTFDQMSIPRFAGWGALGGVALSLVFAKAASFDLRIAIAVIPTFALACAASAAGSLALARKAALRELPDGAPATERGHRFG